MEEQSVFSVSKLTQLIKGTLENSFSNITVIGELSNFKAHVSGHWYFTLKDADAQISCTMWRSVNQQVFFTPQDGMRLMIKGRITVYPPRGNYQLDCRTIKPAGEGELQIAFEKLKKRLSDEGLFDEAHKKPVTGFPEKIGIATSIDGAALRDMISVASRRFPLAELVIAPCKVQGDGAAETIAEAVRLLDSRNDIDTIIVSRGGGSIEDLWCFNEEITARAVYNARTPVISGVGHEVDFTITDFAADLRAPTPSAAMELATPDIRDFFNAIEYFMDEGAEIVLDKIREIKDSVRKYIGPQSFRIPMDMLRLNTQRVDHAIYRLQNSTNAVLNEHKSKMNLLASKLSSGDYRKSLKKGFVFVEQENKLVTRAENFLPEESFSLQFFDEKVRIEK